VRSRKWQCLLKPQVFSGFVCVVQTTDPESTVVLGGFIS
jgi:hypothetical protein